MLGGGLQRTSADIVFGSGAQPQALQRGSRLDDADYDEDEVSAFRQPRLFNKNSTPAQLSKHSSLAMDNSLLPPIHQGLTMPTKGSKLGALQQPPQLLPNKSKFHQHYGNRLPAGSQM